MFELGELLGTRNITSQIHEAMQKQNNVEAESWSLHWLSFPFSEGDIAEWLKALTQVATVPP